MATTSLKRNLERFVANYGMVFVLLLLCVYFSFVTLSVQYPAGAAGGSQLAARIVSQSERPGRALIVVLDTQDDDAFATTLKSGLENGGFTVVETVKGAPVDAREALDRIVAAGQTLDLVACSSVTVAWPVFEDFSRKFPSLATTRMESPRSYRWPSFLKSENLLNVANQIAVIAIIAIGMTMVIITAGIDLSVGSLIALSAVLSTWLIHNLAGAEQATAPGMILSCLVAILACALVGLFSGTMVTLFGTPPFIVTLAMMQVTSGLAYLISEGESIYQIPASFVWLGQGTVGGSLPIAVVLMLLLYGLAHIVMSRMTLGRYIYAVGGNREAARLSGVPVKRVLLLVYTLSGVLAGLGGIVLASQLKSGAPTYGVMYELTVIAAVVVGGTSLFGGEGRIFGTLIGAFIIAVIRNGMNLTEVDPYVQTVTLGLVILGAVTLDRLKKLGWLGLFLKRVFRR